MAERNRPAPGGGLFVPAGLVFAHTVMTRERPRVQRYLLHWFRQWTSASVRWPGATRAGPALDAGPAVVLRKGAPTS